VQRREGSLSDDHGVIDAGQIEHSEEGGTDPAFAVGASAVLNKPNPQVCLDCHGWIDHPNTHPYMPNYYDRVKNAPLTCTSKCHNPHGTTLNFI
jgi:hypothetical protein